MNNNRLLSLYLPVIISLIVSCTAIPTQRVSGTPIPIPQVGETTIPLPQVSDSVIPLLEEDETSSPNAPTPTVYLPLINITTDLPQTEVTEFYVAPNVTANGNGSINNPWDLQTALDHPSVILPGDTIYLREGIYGSGGSTIFKSRLMGAPDRYITVRPYPGEHVVIDGGFWVGVVPCAGCDPIGGWVIFQELEVMNSESNRVTSISGSHPEDISRVDGFDVFAPHSKLINNIVHDTRQGFGFWSQAIDSELYGNIVFNNGWEGPDRGHGHGIYAQNDVGTKTISDNVALNNFGANIHVYGDEAFINGFYLQGNTSINGLLLIGGSQPAERITLKQNFTYGGKVQLGYSSQENVDLTIQNNYFCTPEFTLQVYWWKNVNLSGNTVCALNAYGVSLKSPANPQNYLWNNNQYFVANPDTAFSVEDTARNWDAWKSGTGYDQNSLYSSSMPTGNSVFVRPNQYEPKHGTIIIYNWAQSETVSVDISSLGLAVGDTYILRNTQDYFGNSVTGTYSGQPITVPMIGWTVAIPIGLDEPLQPSTFPKFGVFLLTTDQY